ACGTGFVADIAGRPSRRVLEMAIESVVNLTHRGAMSADGKTGDGAGILTPLPRRLLVEEGARDGKRLSRERLGGRMLFLPREARAQDLARRIVEESLGEAGLDLIQWRVVPVDPTSLGEKAFSTQPRIEQVLVGRPAGLDGSAFERSLYLTRKRIERRAG